jgi:hypothetical protein
MPTNPSGSNQSLQLANSKMNEWFEETIATLLSDHFAIETDIASAAKKQMYHTLASGNAADIHAMGRNSSTVFFIGGILNDYMEIVKERQIQLLKLAFDFSDSKVLVWAEVADDDEVAINKLILAEAKVNSNYSKYGFHLSTTVVETSDNMPIPSPYKEVNIGSKVGVIR